MTFGRPLDEREVNQALVGTRFAHRLRHFASVDSTNAMLLEKAAAGEPEGAVYVADEQTAGRGRGGHTWHSAPGDGLYLSALVRPAVPLQRALLLSLATGLAAQCAVEEATALRVDLRWPNDLLLGSRKCGGILVETAAEAGPGQGPEAKLRYAVIGVGVNLNHTAFPPELDLLATSLRMEGGRPVDRAPVLVCLLRALDRELSQLETDRESESDLLARFDLASTWVHGKRVRVPEQGGYTGTTAGLDPQGFLRVASDDGVVRTVLSGGVREL